MALLKTDYRQSFYFQSTGNEISNEIATVDNDNHSVTVIHNEMNVEVIDLGCPEVEVTHEVPEVEDAKVQC